MLKNTELGTPNMNKPFQQHMTKLPSNTLVIITFCNLRTLRLQKSNIFPFVFPQQQPGCCQGAAGSFNSNYTYHEWGKVLLYHWQLCFTGQWVWRLFLPLTPQLWHHKCMLHVGCYLHEFWESSSTINICKVNTLLAEPFHLFVSFGFPFSQWHFC